jgi:hypothetical protein
MVYKARTSAAIRWTENGERHYSGGYLNEDDARKVLALVTLSIQAGRPGLELLQPEKKIELPPSGLFTRAPEHARSTSTCTGPTIM